MAEVHRLEERLRAAGEHPKPLCVACVRVEELMSERVSLTERTEKGKEECETLPTDIHEPETAVVTSDGELGVMRRAVQSLKSCIAAGEYIANPAEAHVRKTLDRMS